MPETISILLVDDEPRNLDALETILNHPTYRLVRAQDADQALRLLLENDIAAIVLDIRMPVLSGFDLAKLIKGTKKFRDIPIVFMTAHLGDDQDVLAGYDAGAVDFLTKPVNPQILRHKVAVFADLFRKTHALAELNQNLEARVQERTAELERSEAALRAADRQKDVFLATLAHELRNPLAPLRTGLDLLLQQGEQSPLVARTLATMNRQLDHMVRLIGDLLDMSRISRGTLELRKENVDLASVIQRAVETSGPLLARRNQTMTSHSPTPLSADVDATRIAQIVSNLLNNASNYSPSGASVRVELAREGDVGIIRVMDMGMGIPPDQIAQVFEMFTRIQRSATVNADGLGIGLALSRSIAELHGGTLTAASAGEGLGATFTLSLPLGELRATVEIPKTQGTASSNAATLQLRIVIVEDNEDSADVMTTWLEHLGHRVHVARTGPDGVTMAIESRPHVVLCDLGLPGMDGAEVCRHIVRSLGVPPVMIAMTGWGSETDRTRTLEAGFKYHLVKPVELDKLRVLLESVVT
jgi:signal transduction histidine kinase